MREVTDSEFPVVEVQVIVRSLPPEIADVAKVTADNALAHSASVADASELESVSTPVDVSKLAAAILPIDELSLVNARTSPAVK